jgi:hypothetical protein
VWSVIAARRRASFQRVVHELRLGEALDCFGDGSVARAVHPLLGASVFLGSRLQTENRRRLVSRKISTSERVLGGPLVLTIAG